VSAAVSWRRAALGTRALGPRGASRRLMLILPAHCPPSPRHAGRWRQAMRACQRRRLRDTDGLKRYQVCTVAFFHTGRPGNILLRE
jgi:hypothetical protein